jgi:cytochrome c peroxidase
MKKCNLLFVIISCNWAIIGCNLGNETKQNIEKEKNESRRYDLALKEKLEFFEALPSNCNNPENAVSDEKVKLGQMLYFDSRLSANNTISCNSCHNLSKYGVDGLPFSPGDAGKFGGRNSPTVLNAAFHKTQFWDGRAKDVEEQAGMPILNPIEMAIPNEKYLVERLSKVEAYKAAFASAFPSDKVPVNYSNIRKAIAAFERKLLTPSRFDNYLQGDSSALTLVEKKGMMTFASIGCTSCHNGALLGGNSFQKFGVYQNYWEATQSEKHDEGRFETTHQEGDKFLFKTPSLRNVSETSPYFHDGSVKDLGKAVEIMAKVQLNYPISESEKSNIVAFLKSLRGDLPENLKKAPEGLAVLGK